MKRHIALGFLAGTLVLAGCGTAYKAAHWEYKTQTLYFAAGLNPDTLNANAKEGWEFVSATANPRSSNEALVVFKRRIQ